VSKPRIAPAALPPSVTEALAPTVRALAAGRWACLDSSEDGPGWLDLFDDAALRAYAAKRDAPMATARLVELCIRVLPARTAADNASFVRTLAARQTNAQRATQRRATALAKLHRLLAAGRTLRDALSVGWPDKNQRDSVRRWHRENETEK
jgi:hypothetical protein